VRRVGLHLRFDRHGPFGEVGRPRFDSGPNHPSD
jgi:hypothetical protein